MIINADAIQWAEEYEGELFHALICDPPYHLTTITDRFGKEDSAPAKEGTDGAFKRLSTGFMNQVWDGGDIAFQKSTWEAVHDPRRLKVKLFFAWYDFWFGCYFDRNTKALYICPIPMICFKVYFEKSSL